MGRKYYKSAEDYPLDVYGIFPRSHLCNTLNLPDICIAQANPNNPCSTPSDSLHSYNLRDTPLPCKKHPYNGDKNMIILVILL